MHDHIAIVHDQPAVTSLAFFAAFFLVVFSHAIQNGIGQRVEHAVAGAVADDEVVSQGCNLFQFEQQDVFALLFFQSVDDGAGQF